MELIIVYSIMSYFSFFEVFKENKIRKYIPYLGLLSLIILAAISSYSKDFENYKMLFFNNYNLYDTIVEKNFILNPDLRVESGFKFFISIIKLFTDNFNIFLFFYSLLSLLFRFSIYGKLESNLMLYILAYTSFRYLPNEITQYRSSMASAVMFFAMPYLFNRKIAKYFSCVFLGMLFHKGIIIFFPLYFIYPLFLKVKYKLSIFLILLISCYKINFLTKIMELLFKSDSHFQIIKLNNEGMKVGLPIIPLIITIIGIMNFDKIKNEYFKASTFYMVISFMMYSLLIEIPELAIRMANYFYDAQPIILIMSLNIIDNKYLKLIARLILIVFLYFIFMKNYDAIFGELGYKNIFKNN